MTEELGKKISEEQLDQLIRRIKELYDMGVLRISDWIGMYNIMVEACARDKAETYESIIINSFNGDGDDE